MPISIFFCYTREDEELLKKLKAHLRPLQRQGLIDVWYDRDISAGSEWEQEILQHLNAAQILLLLISPDFMDSDYCYGIEMKRALERHKCGEAIVIPIILRPAYWHGEPLGKLQALPTDGKPVTSSYWHDQDSAFYDITSGIHKVIKQLTNRQAPVFSSVEEEHSVETPDITSTLAMQQEEKASLSRATPSVKKLTLLRILVGHLDNVESVAISSDGKTLISGSKDHTIKIWELSSGKEQRTLTGHTDTVESVAISGDGKTLVSGSYDKTIKVWKLPSGEELRTLTGHYDIVTSVAISRDGKRLISGSRDRRIKVWELPAGEEIQTLAGHTNGVRDIAISLDGKTLVSGSWDGTVRIWELSSGKGLQLPTSHTDVVGGVAISGDGKTVVSGGSDRTIKAWELPSGKELRTLTTLTTTVWSVAISFDGKMLISGGSWGTIKVWELPSGKEIQTLTDRTEAVMDIAISADGKTLVSGSADGTIKVWGIEGADLIVHEARH